MNPKICKIPRFVKETNHHLSENGGGTGMGDMRVVHVEREEEIKLEMFLLSFKMTQ